MLIRLFLQRAIVSVCFISTSLMAQETGLATIQVNATRFDKDINQVPIAITTVGQGKIQLGNEQPGVADSLNAVPA